MKECIRDVEMINRPTFSNDNRENKSELGRLEHRVVGLFKIQPRTLTKAFGNKQGFIAKDQTIRVSFDIKNPLTPNNIHGVMRGNETPHVVAK